MLKHRNTGALAAAMTLAVLAGCGGSRGPGVQGPEAVALFRSYSSAWTLDALSSDAIPTPPERGDRNGRGAQAAGRGGGGGAPPGAEAVEAVREVVAVVLPAGRAAVNPEAMQLAMRFATERPERLELTLSDSLFVIEGMSGGTLELPMDGEKIDLPGLRRSDFPVEAEVRWDDGMPQVKRYVGGGSDIIDHFELVTPDRLVLTRTTAGVPGGEEALRFAYDRSGSVP